MVPWEGGKVKLVVFISVYLIVYLISKRSMIHW